jgi:hypothetical protein
MYPGFFFDRSDFKELSTARNNIMGRYKKLEQYTA